MIPHANLPGHAEGWTSADKAKVAAEIGDACRRDGFFFVHNHGIPPDLIAETFDEMERFYRLPVEVKNRYDATEESQFLGYRGLGREKSRTHSGAEACEQYRIGNTTDDLARPESVEFYHEHFPKSTALFGHLTRLGDGLLSACAIDLNLSEYFFEAYLNAPLHRLGLNYYGAGHGQQISNTVDYAMSPHIDLSLLTILTQDEPGLDVKNRDGEWFEVPVVPDALFVFLADYVQRWSNGMHRAAPHRVSRVRKDRRSIQYKHRPDFGTVVAPLDAFIADDNPPKYQPLDTGSDYVAVLRSILGR